MAADKTYEVFLSYHWRDHEEVEFLAQRLRALGLNVFFDRWYLIPGRSWPQELEQHLRDCRSVAVLIGASEMGPWQIREMNYALERQAHESSFSVIPVLLPRAEPNLSFLGQNTWIDLRTAIGDEVGIATLAAAIRGEPPGPDARRQLEQTLSSICPYRGLLHFREEDAPFFFGRNAAVDLLVQAVRTRGLIAVVGASGCGKSSVVRAGLMPALRAANDQVWEIATFVPGDRPLHALAACLAPMLEPKMTEADRLIETNKLARALQADELHVRDIAERVLARQTGTDSLLLIVDQWEELYTLTSEESVRRNFIDHLLEATSAGSLSVVLTLRGDFVGRGLAYRPFSDHLQDAQINVGPMTLSELRQAIEAPASKLALSFEAGLVQRILADAGDEPGNLPLMAFVLRRLWERRRGRSLLHDAYEEMGGLRGAVARKADDIVNSLSLLEQKAVQRIFLQLAQPGEGQEYTRRRATLAEIGAASMPIATRLANERLLVTSPGRGCSEETIEVSHEALIQNWGQLKGWLDEDREFLLWRKRIREWVSAWKLAQSDDILLRGALLVEARRWIQERGGELAQDVRDYIGQSIELTERETERERVHRERELGQAHALAEAQRLRADEQALARRRQRRLTYASLALAGAAMITAVLMFLAQQRAIVAAQISLALKLAAQSEQVADEHLAESLMLAIAAVLLGRTPETESNLFKLLASTHDRVHGILWSPVGELWCATFSPDGKLLASASRRGVILWDVRSRKPVGVPLNTDGATMTSVVFSPDGKLLASAGLDRSVIVWDVASRRPLGEPLRGHTDTVWGLAFSPDGKLLASASFDKTVILWDVASRRPSGKPLEGHKDRVYGVAFSPDGKLLASASADRNIILWDVATHTPLGEPLKGHTLDVSSVAFSPDGKLLASASWDAHVIFWDVATRRALSEPLRGHDSVVFGLAFSPDGKLLASAGLGKTVILWDVASRKALAAPLSGHTAEVTSVSFSPDGKLLASASFDQSVILWDVPNRQSDEFGTALKGHTDEATSVAFSPDGKLLASASADHSVILWDVQRRRAIGAPLRGHAAKVNEVVFSPDGKALASASEDHTVILWDVAKRQVIGTPLSHSAEVKSVAFSPDSKLLASASADHSIILWNVASRQRLGEPLLGHSAAVLTVAFSPDGKLLASGSHDNNIVLWDVASRQSWGAPLKAHKSDVDTLAFSPDGKLLASGSMDESVIVWDLVSRKPVGEPFQGHSGGVYSVAFSHDGKWLASGGGTDPKVVVWDVASHQLMGAPLKQNIQGVIGVLGVAFSPNGKLLATANADRSVTLWDINMDLQSQIAQACGIVNRNMTESEWHSYVGGRNYEKICLGLPGPSEAGWLLTER